MKKTMAKIRASLTNNIDLKIIAVIIAAIVWLAVINISDPEKTLVIYSVPITMTDEESITDQGMVYTVESSQYVNITISGKRSVVSELSADDFTATASLAELSKVNAVPVEVSAANRAVENRITIEKQSVQSVTVSIENIEEQEYNIEVEFSGDADDGYVAGNYSLSKNTVNIQAPTSVLDKISRVVATCDLNGQNSDISQSCKLILYDKRGNEVQDKNISLSNKKVDIYVNILKEKEVAIHVETTGTPADGYRMADISLSQNTVKIVGAEELLEDIDSVEVAEGVDISNQAENVTQTIDLSEYLPEGVSIDGDNEIQVTVEIEELVTKTLRIKTSDLNVENLGDNLEVRYPADTITVELRGEKDVIDQITEQDLNATINLEGLEKGTYTIPVSITVPGDTQLLEQVTVRIRLR